MLERAPEQAIPGLTRALENSRNGRNAVEQIRGDQHPNELAPGQLKKTPDPLEDESKLSPGQLKKEEEHGRDLPPGQPKKAQTPDSKGTD